ncbi:MAG: hypothetical protein R3D00_19665 [Bacteroidia bacterium]
MKPPRHTILYFLPLAAFVVVRWGMDFNGLYGQDGHSFYQFSLEIIRSLRGNADFSQFRVPPIYPLAGAIPGFFAGHPDFFLQLISALSLTGTAWMADRIIRHIHPKSPENSVATYLSVILILSPYMLRGSLMVMTDLMTTFLSTLAVYYIIQYRQQTAARQIILLTGAASLAFLTRYAVAPLLAIPCTLVIGIMIREKKWTHIVLAAGVVLICFVPFLLIKQGNTNEFANHHLMTSWSVLNAFRRSFSGPDGTANYQIINLVTVFYHFFHPAYIFPGIALVIFVRKVDLQKESVKFLLASIVLYSLFIAGLNFQNKRYLILSFPLVAICFFPAWQRIKAQIPTTTFTIAVIITAFIQLAFSAYLFRSFYKISQTEKFLVKEISALPPTLLYTFELNMAFKSYEVPHQVHSLYDRKIDIFPENSLLLVNEVKWENQWKDQNPVINMNFARSQYETELLNQFPEGWTLYRIRERKRRQP